MRIGEIYRWNTRSVTGRDSRDKMHVYVCDDADGGDCLFFFVNKEPWAPYDVHLPKSECGILEYDPSYLDMMPVPYDVRTIGGFGPGRPIHQLSVGYLKELVGAVDVNKVLERYEKSRICRALMRRITELG